MSTKIHNGYRLTPDTNIWAFQRVLRDTLNPVRDRVDASWLMRKAVQLVDQADVKGEPRPKSPLSAAAWVFADEQDTEAAKGYGRAVMSHSFDPHRLEVSFMLDAPEATGAATGTGHVMCLLYTENVELRHTFQALPQVQDFHYQDSTDGPDDVTVQDWQERKQAWARVLPGNSAPIECMLQFSLRSAYSPTGMIGIACPGKEPGAAAAWRAMMGAVAPTYEDRLHEFMRDQLVTTHMSKLNVGDGDVFRALAQIDLQARKRLSGTGFGGLPLADFRAACADVVHCRVVDDIVNGCVQPRVVPADMGRVRDAAAAVTLEVG